MADDTIAAVATAIAPGEGSVAIVRLSGPEAEAIGRLLFVPVGVQPWESHRVLYGHVCDPASAERVDEALLLLMRAPRSFTRETVVEFHCHGGLICVQRVLELVLTSGARRALPGEFSQRAFLNGRLDLTRAEAVSELVTARSRRAAQLAMAGLDGGLQARIASLRERLLDLAVITRPGTPIGAAAADLLELPLLHHSDSQDLILLRRDTSDHPAVQSLIAALKQQVSQHLRQHPEQEWLG